MESKIIKPSDHSESDEEKLMVKKAVEEIESANPEIFDGVSQKEEVVQAVIHHCLSIKSIEYAEMHQGPLPSPRTLKAYGEIVENGAERIMQSAEEQAEHRREIESKVINGQVNQSQIGQIMGFIIAILFLLVGFYLIIHEYEISGVIIASIDLVGLVSVFVIGRHKKYKMKEE